MKNLEDFRIVDAGEGPNLYRYHSRRHYAYDTPGSDYPSGWTTEVELETWVVLSETRTGYWVAQAGRQLRTTRRWMDRGARRPFAYGDRLEALKSFLMRQERRIDHAEAELRQAKEGHLKAARMLRAEGVDVEDLVAEERPW